MNHGPKFQKVCFPPSEHLANEANNQLMAEIKADVREMQVRGNYGDGELIAANRPTLTERILV